MNSRLIFLPCYQCVLGKYDRAIELYQQSLAIAEEIADRQEKGRTFSSIGSVHLSLGNYHEAIEYYQQSLDITREFSDRLGGGGIIGKHEQCLLLFR